MNDLLSIGAAAKASGVSAKMIRHYESIGLLPRAERSNGNYRLYGSQDVHNLRFIHRARSLGFPLETIRELLALWRNRQRSSAQVKKLAQEKIVDLRARIAGLQAMLTSLEGLVCCCHGDENPECPILDELEKG